ncbi:MAG TPA: hypothetical protein VGJ44_27270 [Kribbellaceae bacterium]|jgi:hypothetical protein
MRAAFAGNTPAAGATGYTPNLGDGARGTGRQSRGRGLTPPGRDDRS